MMLINGEMFCLNTDTMVEQKFAIKENFCDHNVVFETEQRKTHKGTIYYWFNWKVYPEGEVPKL